MDIFIHDTYFIFDGRAIAVGAMLVTSIVAVMLFVLISRRKSK